ncbi:MAG: hypothetical protein WAO69_00105 [Aestuariivita sp.]|uniref:hypothetical protein n=1 Tax=Aestuariivita sp. TaxID=1872407 RepID=UPI003BB0F719
MMGIATHELSHALCNSGSGGLLVRIGHDDWEFRPHTQPEGEDFVIAMLAGPTGERTMQLGIDGAAHMLDTDPAGFFATPCASPEDLVMPSCDPSTCASMVRKHQLIERLAHALNEMGAARIKAFARSMEATQVGDGLRLEGLPPLPPLRRVH